MSFFGFDAALPKDRGHSTNAPGFGQTPDAFAGLGATGGGVDDVYVVLQGATTNGANSIL
jgi:DNA topoisomerase 2-associated protein PAT1